MPVAQLIPIVFMIVGSIKKFIPNKTRDIANPVIAVISGLALAYASGGQSELTNVLMDGLSAAVGAMGAYSTPKMIGKNIGVD